MPRRPGSRLIPVDPRGSPVTPSLLVPNLDELAADPTKTATLHPETARVLTFRCLALLAALASVTGVTHGPTTLEAEQDRLLTVEDAARTLGVSKDWLYRRAEKLPFTIRLGRTLRFSAHSLARYIRSREGR